MFFNWTWQTPSIQCQGGSCFQEICAAHGDIIQFIPFVRLFYAFESPPFYNHHNGEGDVTIILSVMRTHQGDPWGGEGGALFVLTHFRALCFIASHFPFRLFPFIVDDTHIIGPLSIISSAYEHLYTELCAISFSIQPQKCVTWSPFDLPPNFNTSSQFTTPFKGIRVLGVPLSSLTFTLSFIKYALLEDVGHVDLFLKIYDVQVAFGILTCCFVQRSLYLLSCIPPSSTFI